MHFQFRSFHGPLLFQKISSKPYKILASIYDAKFLYLFLEGDY